MLWCMTGMDNYTCSTCNLSEYAYHSNMLAGRSNITALPEKVLFDSINLI